MKQINLERVQEWADIQNSIQKAEMRRIQAVNEISELKKSQTGLEKLLSDEFIIKGFTGDHYILTDRGILSIKQVNNTIPGEGFAPCKQATSFVFKFHEAVIDART